jgi:hypothetical protein
VKPLLLAARVLVVQVLLIGAYTTVLSVARRPVAWLVWLAGTVVVALVAFALVKGMCHECLTAASVVACPHRNNAVAVEVESQRIGGYIKERNYFGCTFYWHENNTHGN